MAEETNGNGKVDMAILKTLLSGVKERLGELQSSQQAFLRDWPNHVAKVVGLETRVDNLEEHHAGGSTRTANLLSLLSVICTLGLLLWEVFGRK